MEQRKIKIEKTGRYFVLGDSSAEIEQVWFVCHGYAQLANYFLKNFELLNDGKTLIVAPEGLSRFYWEGVAGKVVASWMTKEDREDDIHDYVNYLDAVYSEVISQIKNRSVKINVLGFSQGVATVCRWLASGGSQADNLFLWAGAFPSDLNLELNKKILDALHITFVMGDNDQYITEEKVQEHIKMLEKSTLKYNVVRFEGGHEINSEALKKVSGQFLKADH
jgi:predicted esterase